MHLSDEKIAKFIDGRINKEEREEYLYHISECSECFEVYTESVKSLDSKEYEKSQKRLFMVIIRKKRFIPLLAVALLLISIPFIWKSINTSVSEQQFLELEKILVANGTQKELILDDGTRVILDAGSSFQYPKRFNSEIREVYLVGEGYFEVPEIKNKPFIVNAGHAVIKVLGTKFNIRAWEQTQKVKVVVAEGKVSLCSRSADPASAVLISRGELSILPKYGQPSNPVGVDIDKHLGWLTRDIEFHNTPMQEILSQLERWYDIHFFLDENIPVFDQLTIHIQDRPVDEIIELIADLMTLEYKLEGKTVYLKVIK